jgi:hypothetical protein
LIYSTKEENQNIIGFDVILSSECIFPLSTDATSSNDTEYQ